MCNDFSGGFSCILKNENKIVLCDSLLWCGGGLLMRRREDKLWESVLSSRSMGLRGQTQ